MAANPNSALPPVRRLLLAAVVGIVAVTGVAAYFFWPQVRSYLQLQKAPNLATETAPTTDHAAEGDHAEAVDITPEARRMIGLTVGQLKRGEFQRTVALPGIVVERPGYSKILVTTHLTGVVSRIEVEEGQVVEPGGPLAEIRLTHEEVIQSQAELLRSSRELVILNEELKRLEGIAREGAIPGKTLLEKQYEQRRLQNTIDAQRQALLLHDMSAAQIDSLLDSGKLLGSIAVPVPADELPAATGQTPAILQLHELPIAHGQHIAAGETLAVLGDHSQLLVEGEAFERDGPAILRALAEKWPIQIVGDQPAGGANDEPPALELLYVSDTIDPQSRTFHFYAALPNRVVSDRTTNGRRYVQWRFRPGERLRLEVPVERKSDQLVVPIAALAEEGVETYVFRLTEGHFVRTPVQVVDRDQRYAVIAGKDLEGKIIAMTAAQQLQFALAAQSSGGGGDHHGHMH
jgi:multidrug efflux pump subunit AcrA (membrane-fusion protein)